MVQFNFSIMRKDILESLLVKKKQELTRLEDRPYCELRLLVLLLKVLTESGITECIGTCCPSIYSMFKSGQQLSHMVYAYRVTIDLLQNNGLNVVEWY